MSTLDRRVPCFRLRKHVRAIFIRPETNNKETAGNSEDMLLATATTPEAWHPFGGFGTMPPASPVKKKSLARPVFLLPNSASRFSI
jgi:hypothetical protein